MADEKRPDNQGGEGAGDSQDNSGIEKPNPDIEAPQFDLHTEGYDPSNIRNKLRELLIKKDKE